MREDYLFLVFTLGVAAATNTRMNELIAKVSPRNRIGTAEFQESFIY